MVQPEGIHHNTQEQKGSQYLYYRPQDLTVFIFVVWFIWGTGHPNCAQRSLEATLDILVQHGVVVHSEDQMMWQISSPSKPGIMWACLRVQGGLVGPQPAVLMRMSGVFRSIPGVFRSTAVFQVLSVDHFTQGIEPGWLNTGT